jgi:hypothetical protein
MDRCLLAVIVVSVIFIITYDPQKGNLNNFIPQKEKFTEEKVPCCNKLDYRSTHPWQCEPAYYQGLQFADPNYGCPPVQPVVYKGAIMSQ